MLKFFCCFSSWVFISLKIIRHHRVRTLVMQLILRLAIFNNKIICIIISNATMHLIICFFKHRMESREGGEINFGIQTHWLLSSLWWWWWCRRSGFVIPHHRVTISNQLSLIIDRIITTVAYAQTFNILLTCWLFFYYYYFLNEFVLATWKKVSCRNCSTLIRFVE